MCNRETLKLASSVHILKIALFPWSILFMILLFLSGDL